MGDVPIPSTKSPPPQGSWALACLMASCPGPRSLPAPQAALELINHVRAAPGKEQKPQGWGLDKPGPWTRAAH